MSNNYSEYRTTIFPSRENRDVWVTKCIIARAASPEWLTDDPTIEGFEPIGERCLRIWHNYNVKTAYASKLLEVNRQLSEFQPQLPWIGNHHVEGEKYCFDIGINGKHLSLDSFPLMMHDAIDCDDGHYGLRDSFFTYKSWISEISKILTPDAEITPSRWGKDFTRDNFIGVMRSIEGASKLLKYAKTDTQIETLHEILVSMMRDAIVSYETYVMTPTDVKIFEDGS